MTVLDSRFFKGGGDLSLDYVNKLSNNGTEDGINETLTRWGWEGQLVAGIVLAVSTDGSTAQDGSFFVRGPLAEEAVVLQASKIWQKAEADISLSLMLPRGEQFKFQEGNVYSSYLELDRSQFAQEGRQGH